MDNNLELKEAKETVQERTIADVVLNRVEELKKDGGLQMPGNYSSSNALKSAWLILQETKDREKNPVLQTCNKLSIINSLLNMTIQGLSPAKKQCYFVAYGKSLTLMRSYMGTVAVTKRLKGIRDVKAYCIYEGDEFEQEYDLETATLKITKFNPKFENIDNTKIKGAFAVVIGENGPIHTEVMNFNQIQKAWGMGTSYKSGKSTTHKDFAEEMAKKSVINRACKMFANTSDDSDILIDAFNQSDEIEHDKDKIIENVQTEVKDEVEEKGNTKPIDIEDHEEKEKVIDVEVNKEKEPPKTQDGPAF